MNPFNPHAFGFAQFGQNQGDPNAPQPNPSSQWGGFMAMLGATQAPGGGIVGFDAPNQETVPETQPDPTTNVGSSRKNTRKHAKKAPGEPRAKKKTIPWNSDEYTMLARAWLAISENPQCANFIKHNIFWDKVTKLFFELGGNSERERDSLQSKWSDMNAKCKMFNSIYTRMKNSWGSGVSDAEIITRATVEYNHRAGAWLYAEAWLKMRNHANWCPVSAAASSETPRPSKRSKTDDSVDPETPTSDARNIDLNDDSQPDYEDVFEIPRPAGRRKSKGKAQVGTSAGVDGVDMSAHFSEMNIQLRELNQLGMRRLEVNSRVADAILDRQLQEDIAFLSEELPPNDPEIIRLKEKRRRNILARHRD
ncbi:hypothetical protein QVD17_20900 [Tagetes erecta]|uniref:No apical meristem-associated C-terminal domain-containing protein n=1 Tax=Tagetes erecta TaxID=13708 RepID=A0AAD8KQS9_TARER|nr:hypothetical protein QVD17_20900 [Tagetes erecta]